MKRIFSQFSVLHMKEVFFVNISETLFSLWLINSVTNGFPNPHYSYQKARLW